MVSKGGHTYIYWADAPPFFLISIYFKILNAVFFMGCWNVARWLSPSVLAPWNWQFPFTRGEPKRAWARSVVFSALLCAYNSSLICRNMQIKIFRTWKQALSTANACNYLTLDTPQKQVKTAGSPNQRKPFTATDVHKNVVGGVSSVKLLIIYNPLL